MQIILFLLLVLFVLFIFASQKNSMSKDVKIYLVLSLFVILLVGWLYTSYNQKIAITERDIINAFRQGKMLTCASYKVSNKGFIFVSGTLSFVAKNSNEKYRGIVIDISTCKP